MAVFLGLVGSGSGATLRELLCTGLARMGDRRGVLEPNTLHRLQDHLVDHLIDRDGVLLELALSASEPIRPNFIVSIHAFEAQCQILGLELGERGVVRDIIGDI